MDANHSANLEAWNFCSRSQFDTEAKRGHWAVVRGNPLWRAIARQSWPLLGLEDPAAFLGRVAPERGLGRHLRDAR
ncbi:hypothetical protein GN958_ATG17159 [Phytophthora infestans]|uniref:Uncharacterized protein n=1 Tax=Phytophthora infestans TaxID=4787 RepID=A0A8S9U290_PHYIN|nr:hypothetical protein GN958_ATG17159 [Phytophthora infestans]